MAIERLLARFGGTLCASAIAATMPVGDAHRGAEIYARCAACHALQYDRTGPRHCGLIGRRAASVPGYDYSPAMSRSGLTWYAETLDRFLADPTRTVPGTTMTYAGIVNAQERADVIAYLRDAGQSAACRPARAGTPPPERTGPQGQACVRCKYTDCVDVCPTDAFREGPNFLVIDPDECIAAIFGALNAFVKR